MESLALNAAELGNSSQAEQTKWNEIYASMPEAEVGAAEASFHEELIDAVAALLPNPARILESGCGAGAQGIALASKGRHRVTLLDFAANALTYAQRQAQRSGVEVATELGDAFAHGKPEFDLVFNAGVLEHYELPEQVAMLRAMASRSRAYVMVLIPNALCFAYWIWRQQSAAKGQWPYGKEVPRASLEDLFREAGMTLMGHAYLGRAYTQHFIRSWEGADPALVDRALGLLTSEAVHPASQGYLIAAVGVVHAGEGGLRALAGPWGAAAAPSLHTYDRQGAILADALANELHAHQRVAEANARISELRLALESERAAVSCAVEQAKAYRLESQRVLREAEQMIAAMQAQVASTQAQAKAGSDMAAQAIAAAQGTAEAYRQEAQRALSGSEQMIAAMQAQVASTQAQAKAGSDMAAQAIAEAQRTAEAYRQEAQRALTGSEQMIAAMQTQLASTQEQASRMIGEAQLNTETYRKQLADAQQSAQEMLSHIQEELTHSQRSAVESLKAHQAEVAQIHAAFEAERRGFSQSLADQQRITLHAHSQAEQVHVQLVAATAEHARSIQEMTTVAQAQLDQLRSEANLASRRAEQDLAAVQRQLVAYRTAFERVTQSKSWKLTMPMRVIARWVRHGPEAADKQRLFSIAARIGHALPLPKAWVRAIGHAVKPSPPAPIQFVTAQREPLSAVQNGVVATPSVATPTVPPTVTAPQNHHVFVWAVIDWHFRFQRPQQIAQQIAAQGTPLFYVSNEMRDAQEPGYSLEPLAGIPGLWQVHLYLPKPPVIYTTLPDARVMHDIRSAIGKLLLGMGVTYSTQIVDHPFWTDIASSMPNSRMIYDCMDHHAGFDNTAPAMMAQERRLLMISDLVVSTSGWLRERLLEDGRDSTVIRNGCDIDFFTAPVTTSKRGQWKGRVIGYFGAIAEWMDADLLHDICKAHPNDTLLMIGYDTANVQKRLSDCPNAVFVGEVKYAELPGYMAAFDCALLPFRVTDLTLATNPVKLYEYLAAAQSVVAIELPETKQFASVARVVQRPDFVGAVTAALSAPPTSAEREARVAFARDHSWAARAGAFIEVMKSPLEDVQPSISVIVVTYNNLELTQACLDSVEKDCQAERLEVIVVDNNSQDGTPEYLKAWVNGAPHRQIVLNPDNKGFSAANNQGLAVAKGQYLALLNNDTYVTPGWARGLRSHLKRDPKLGAVGPATNNIGNEARIAEAIYPDIPAMLTFAREFTYARMGQSMSIRAPAFFCVMWTREVYDKLGGLDENFGLGFFEDDDYSMRVKRAGYDLQCVDDVFVHHHLSASFDKLKQSARQALMEKNKAYFESKWGPWKPHVYRGAPGAGT